MSAKIKLNGRHAFAIGLLRFLRRIFMRPITTILLGIGVSICGVAEMLEELFVGFESKVGAYHGVILFGGVTMFRGLVEFLEGLEFLGFEFEEEASRQAAARPAASDR